VIVGERVICEAKWVQFWVKKHQKKKNLCLSNIIFSFSPFFLFSFPSSDPLISGYFTALCPPLLVIFSTFGGVLFHSPFFSPLMAPRWSFVFLIGGLFLDEVFE